MSRQKIKKDGQQAREHVSYGHVVKNQCFSCKRRFMPKLQCEAFPDAIPAAIFMGAFDHTHPYNMDGEDDHGLTYIPRDEELMENSILSKK